MIQNSIIAESVSSQCDLLSPAAIERNGLLK